MVLSGIFVRFNYFVLFFIGACRFAVIVPEIQQDLNRNKSEESLEAFLARAFIINHNISRMSPQFNPNHSGNIVIN